MEGRRLRSRRTFLTLVLFFCALSPFVVKADEDNNEYKDGEVIPFLVNTIGPYANPSEIYSYYSLPVCAPPKEQRSPDRTFNLGESLEGDEFKKSLYILKFKGSSLYCVSLGLVATRPIVFASHPSEEEKDKPLCSKQFTVEEVTRLKKAIEEYYYFELLCGSSVSSDFSSCCHNLCLIIGVILSQMICLFTALSAL